MSEHLSSTPQPQGYTPEFLAAKKAEYSHRNFFQAKIIGAFETSSEFQELDYFEMMRIISEAFTRKFDQEEKVGRLPEMPADDPELVKAWVAEFRELLLARLAEIRASQQSSQDTPSANA